MRVLRLSAAGTTPTTSVVLPRPPTAPPTSREDDSLGKAASPRAQSSVGRPRLKAPPSRW